MSCSPDATPLTAELKQAARDLGFSLVGVAPAVAPPGYPRFLDWLNRGFAGEMGYLERRKHAYAHPEGVLPAVKSVVMLGLNYNTPPAKQRRQATVSPVSSGGARVSAYAWGEADYHDLVRKQLKTLSRWLRDRQSDAFVRGIVDTAPLLERDFARLAGLGWFGKNTLLLNKQAGSFFFLAALLTDAILAYDPPHLAHHCGTCTRCLEACPTQAFPEPSVLDATRCISYLTIELKGSIPLELRPAIGDWVFGCDICQDVCPWNRKAPLTEEPQFLPREDLHPANALDLLNISEEEFQARFAKSPLARPGRTGLSRNAAIVLGNTADRSALPALQTAAQQTDPIIREAALWAIERIEQRHPDPADS